MKIDLKTVNYVAKYLANHRTCYLIELDEYTLKYLEKFFNVKKTKKGYLILDTL